MSDDWGGEAHPQFILCLTENNEPLELDLGEVASVIWGKGAGNARVILSSGLVISLTYPKTQTEFRAAWMSAKRNVRYK